MEGGSGIVTRADVAAAAGVSEATVSRVLNNVGPLREATRRKVLEAAEALGYYPNAMARNFALRKSGNLGVILPYLPKVKLFSTFYFAEILNGIGEAAGDHGFDMLLLFQKPGMPLDYKHYFLSHKVDVCIILGAKDNKEERKALRELRELQLPFCLINQHFEGEAFNEIDADHREGSYQVVRHLLQQGCKRIAFLNGPMDYSNSRDRQEGYRLAMADRYDEGSVFYGNYSRKSGYQATDRLMKEGPFDGIFASNDRMAIGVMQRLKEYGMHAGRHVALAGYDNSDASTMCDPPLTTVHVPFFEMGSMAATRLLEQFASKTYATIREKLKPALIARASSRLSK